MSLSEQSQQVMTHQSFITYDEIRRHNLITKNTEVVTLQDMLDAYYPWQKNPDFFKDPIQKAHDPTLTSSTGVLNRVYGEMVWNQLNQEANIWGLLPKRAWSHSGMRYLTTNSATGGGIAEGATLPEADQPAIALGYSDPKTVVHRFQISQQAQLQARARDDMLGSPKEFYREYTATRHRSVINSYLGSEADTLSGDNMETIDRMVSATILVTNGHITAGDEDFEKIDRSANSWADAYTDDNSTVDRDLTPEMIRDLLRGTRKYQEVPNSQKIIITGEDTFERISSLYEGQNRFKQNEVQIQPSVNGAQVIRAGQAAGFTVSTLYGIPIFISKDIQVDTISRLYLLDLAYTHLDILAPTQYFEQGPSKGNPQALNNLNDDGIFVTMAELRCSRFNAHGVIRDLQ